jgi:hypothetical protein
LLTTDDEHRFSFFVGSRQNSVGLFEGWRFGCVGFIVCSGDGTFLIYFVGCPDCLIGIVLLNLHIYDLQSIVLV